LVKYYILKDTTRTSTANSKLVGKKSTALQCWNRSTVPYRALWKKNLHVGSVSAFCSLSVLTKMIGITL